MKNQTNNSSIFDRFPIAEEMKPTRKFSCKSLKNSNVRKKGRKKENKTSNKIVRAVKFKKKSSGSSPWRLFAGCGKGEKTVKKNGLG